jgi:hypothetical protein
MGEFCAVVLEHCEGEAYQWFLLVGVAMLDLLWLVFSGASIMQVASS